MRKIRVLLCFFCVICLLLAFSGCESNQQVQEKTFFEYFDTVSVIYSYAGDSKEAFEENCREIEKILYKYHRLFDIYNEYDGMVNLCTVNKNAGGDALAVDSELIEFLLYAKDLYTLTNGEMNVMMGSVLTLWHECREAASTDSKAARIPSKEELAEAEKHTSIELLEINAEAETVRISDPDALIDVGAIGKGYATEQIARFLKNKGLDAYALDIGGNLRLVGTKPNGDSWVTGIKDPRISGNYALRLRLSNVSCVTSGDYERYFEVDGKRYHHIIDKDTLMPAEHFASVTVVCEDSALADVLSTALFCMTVQEGRALIESLEGVEVVWITQDGELLYTDGVEALWVKK